MSDTVLFVDDEESVLSSLTRLFMDSDIPTRTASDPFQALELLKSEKISVLLVDNMMPGMRGLELLELAKTVSPLTVKVMMTAFADLPTVVEAINRGDVFRFVVKPWDNSELEAVIREGIERFHLLESLSRENEDVLYALAETIELKDPYTKGHCERVAGYALMIADALGLPNRIKTDLRFGSWLHDCGKIGVPESLLNAARKLSRDEFSIIRLHPEWGAEVARKAKMTPTVVNIILHHHENFDGSGYPGKLKGREIPLESRIVAIADSFDAMTTKRPYHRPYSTAEAKDCLSAQAGIRLDPELVELFLHVLEEKGGA